jgi:hypothetical protein
LKGAPGTTTIFAHFIAYFYLGSILCPTLLGLVLGVIPFPICRGPFDASMATDLCDGSERVFFENIAFQGYLQMISALQSTTQQTQSMGNRFSVVDLGIHRLDPTMDKKSW